ncbi:MAG: hypothetical protein HXY50_13830 [Ignavibacteriaceae bacterium]|nr:hypothetical protein [Ignavibacteriaceae bacterium]
MIKSLLYKEWLKIRWSFIGLLLVNLIVVVSICVSLYNDFKFYKPNQIYDGVLSWGYVFYIDLMYIPLATGLLLGVVQFFSEINSSRLKLTLHLPMKESSSLLSMQWYGLGLLVLIFIIDAVIISILTSSYFPYEVVNSFLSISLPWFLAGLTAYIFISLIFVEPSWSRRIFMAVVGVGFVNLLFSNIIAMGIEAIFSRTDLYFFIITILLTPIILLAGYNYKKGIR